MRARTSLLVPQLKGVAPDAARSRQGELLEALGLVSDRRTSARLLSGGARRKLSVAIALVGDSKVSHVAGPRGLTFKRDTEKQSHRKTETDREAEIDRERREPADRQTH